VPDDDPRDRGALLRPTVPPGQARPQLLCWNHVGVTGADVHKQDQVAVCRGSGDEQTPPLLLAHKRGHLVRPVAGSRVGRHWAARAWTVDSGNAEPAPRPARPAALVPAALPAADQRGRAGDATAIGVMQAPASTAAGDCLARSEVAELMIELATKCNLATPRCSQSASKQGSEARRRPASLLSPTRRPARRFCFHCASARNRRMPQSLSAGLASLPGCVQKSRECRPRHRTRRSCIGRAGRRRGAGALLRVVPSSDEISEGDECRSPRGCTRRLIRAPSPSRADQDAPRRRGPARRGDRGRARTIVWSVYRVCSRRKQPAAWPAW
jgi:hypothetical protein